MKLTWITAACCLFAVACASSPEAPIETPADAADEEPAVAAPMEPARFGMDAVEMQFDAPQAPEHADADEAAPATRLSPHTASKGGKLRYSR